MGKVYSSFVKRPAQNFNIESRVFRKIEKNEATRPNPAPKHDTTKERLQQFQKEHPELLELQKQKSEKLNNMLKGMVVNPDKVQEISHRPLPTAKNNLYTSEYGYEEPEKIREGKASLRQILEFINKRTVEPTKYDTSNIAQTYKLDESTVQNILQHFQVLQIQIPQTDKQQSAESTAVPVKKLLGQRNSIKDITPGKTEPPS